MITEQQALDLLHKYDLSDSRIRHCIGVADIAFELATKIHDRHPELSLDPAKVKIAALLHDIGRSAKGDHELLTIEILKKEGLEDLANITIHGSIYEISILRGKADPTLLPCTIENKIVAYADARFRDQPVSMKQRWEEIEQRRAGEKEKIRSLHLAKARYIALERELLNLAGD